MSTRLEEREKMIPSELYDCIKAKYPIYEVGCVCHVESTCFKNGFCSGMQHTPVLDFDKIKDDYYKGQVVATPASVDAVCVGGHQKYFCFVEMKGWDNYINYLDKQKKSVKETVENYNLERKLLDSQRLCVNIVNKSDLFAQMPVIFLLVTDINVKTNGIVALADMMNKLGSNSTDIYTNCLFASKQTLDSEIHIDHQYIYCREFDNEISVL